MRKNKVLAALSAIAVLGFSACEKEGLTPQHSASSATTQTLRNPVYDAGVKAIKDYPAYQETNLNYYRIYFNTALGLQTASHYYFGGDVTSSAKGYGYAINPSTGVVAEAYTYVNSGITILNYNGTEVPIMLDATHYFTYAVSEIEIDPSTLDVYILCRFKNIKLYRVDASTGLVTIITLGGNPYIYSALTDPAYMSSTFCFVPVSSSYHLVFGYEQSSASSIQFKHYTISGNTLVTQSSYDKACTSSNLFNLTGDINSAYGDGDFYFGRDAGDLFKISDMTITSGTATATQVNSGTFGLSYDYGYWRNF